MKALAADLYDADRRAQLARGLDALVLRVRDLPVAREAALFLVADVELAWRMFSHGAPRRGARRMTPAVQAAKRAGIEFRLHEYEGVELGDGDYALAVAKALDRPPAQLFKTLIVSVDGDLRAFVVPADQQLDLRSVGKRAELAGRAQAERATGYVVGGISPLGQRRRLPTWSTRPRSSGRRSSSAPDGAACRSSSRRRT